MIKTWSYAEEYKKNRSKILKTIDKTLASGNLFFGKQLDTFEKNFINLIHYGLTKGKINEDEYDLLNEIFEDRFGDKEEERFEFTSAIK